MVSLILRETIKNYRKTLNRYQRAATYKKRPFRLKYPHKAEAVIRQKISSMFKRYTKKMIEFIEERYPKPAPRIDNFATEFELFMREFESNIQVEITGGSIDIGPFVNKILEFMLRFKEEEIAEYMVSITGRPFFGTTEWWSSTKSQWIDVLNRSITKNIEEYTDKIREVVYNAVKEQKGIDYTIGEIKRVNASLDDKKATFLARDMTGKLNGTIERELQTSIGIEAYLWQTMRDERVRGIPGGVYANAIPSHWAMESKVCKWADVSVVSIDFGRTWMPRSSDMPYKHPGEDWLCRCSGVPFSLSLIREIDKEIAREEGRGR